MRRSAWITLAVLILAGACSSTDVTPSAGVTTLQPVWPRYFTVEWSAAPAAGATRLTGYVYNNYGFAADRVQLLAQALDASGSVVGQRLVTLPNSVVPHDRESFTVDGLPPMASYRVTVWNFDFRLKR